MARQTPDQQATVERVMHEFKRGELKGSDDKRVKNPKQAVAIALSEAGSSDRGSTETNKRNLARTKREERAGETGKSRTAATGKTKAELYSEAKRKSITKRSTMSKSELEKALRA